MFLSPSGMMGLLWSLQTGKNANQPTRTLAKIALLCAQANDGKKNGKIICLRKRHRIALILGTYRKVYSEGTNRAFSHYQKRDDSGVRVDLMDNEIEAHSM